MKIELRPYQNAALQAIYDYWGAGGGNPLIDLATGTGKSMVIAKMVQDLIAAFPDMRIVILVHVRELVAQNFKALLAVWPDAPAGIYSAGLGQRNGHHKITFASVQSVYRKPDVLGPRDLVLIDEAHLVPTAGEGMYRKLLDALKSKRIDLRVAGCTATPYRLDSGRLDRGKGALFDETVYTYGIGEGIRDGYLSPLKSKASATEIDVSNVAKRGGEFVPGQLQDAADAITQEACEEIVRFGASRRAWLIFCAGVQHSIHVSNTLKEMGVRCETVSGETSMGERDRIINQFRAGEIQAITNANVLTTGFDVPHVDMVAMLRPTLSTSLYVQIVGRGTRIAPGKKDCLILDFAGNCRRHGPVDNVNVSGGPSSKKDDEGKVSEDSVRGKYCPECGDLLPVNAPNCGTCGYEYPSKPKHEAQADGDAAVLSTERLKPKQAPVTKWTLSRHEKPGSPDSVRVTYVAGISEFREWLAFEHTGYANQKACQWWALHGGMSPFPRSVQEALGRAGELKMPTTITVQPNGKYFNIVSREFGELPPDFDQAPDIELDEIPF